MFFIKKALLLSYFTGSSGMKKLLAVSLKKSREKFSFHLIWKLTDFDISVIDFHHFQITTLNFLVKTLTIFKKKKKNVLRGDNTLGFQLSK